MTLIFKQFMILLWVITKDSPSDPQNMSLLLFSDWCSYFIKTISGCPRFSRVSMALKWRFELSKRRIL